MRPNRLRVVVIILILHYKLLLAGLGDSMAFVNYYIECG